MTSQQQVIFFADVSGSTRLYEKEGDVIAHQCIVDSLNRMRVVIERTNGRVVETIGDELMATFNLPFDAARAAADIQNDFKHRPSQTGHMMGIRIGFHFGPVEYDAHDHPFGDSINTAARVVALAQAGQIVFTEASLQGDARTLPFDVRPFVKTFVKGKADPLSTFELIWDIDEATSIFAAASNTRAEPGLAPGRNVALTYQGRHYELSPSRPTFVFGRGQQCDVQVNSDMASRSHAKIEFRWGEWILIDHSTNGTYVVTDPGKRTYDGLNLRLHHREWIMQGRGSISLGQPADKDTENAVLFTLES